MTKGGPFVSLRAFFETRSDGRKAGRPLSFAEGLLSLLDESVDLEEPELRRAPFPGGDTLDDEVLGDLLDLLDFFLRAMAKDVFEWCWSGDKVVAMQLNDECRGCRRQGQTVNDKDGKEARCSWKVQGEGRV